MLRSFVLLSCLAGLCLPALGGEWEARLLLYALEREVDSRSEPEVRRALDHLRAAHPDLFEHRLPPGALRSAIVSQLDHEEARELLSRARRTPELAGQRSAAVVANFGSRADLPDLILLTGVIEDLLPRHRRLLSEIAQGALLDGDRKLALRLLSDPASAAKTAEDLCDLRWSDGMRLLADVVGGAIELPPEARANLGTAAPNLSFYYRRPIDAGRAAALSKTARSDPDHALRLLAARLLLRVGTEDVFDHVVEAYAACQSVQMDRWEWRRVGSWYHRRAFPPDVPIHAVLSVLRGSAMFGQIFADDDPPAAERLARDFRRLYEEAPDPRFRGELLRELDWLHVHLYDSRGRRRHAVRSYLAFLRELADGRADDTPEIRDLGRRLSRGLLADLGREPVSPYRRGWVPVPRERGEKAPDFSFRSVWPEPELRRMDPEEERALADPILTAADPFEAWKAARALDESDSVTAYSTLLFASERLSAADEGNAPSVPSATVHVDSTEKLEVLLRFVEDSEVSPQIRLAAFESLRDLWFDEETVEKTRPLLHQIDAWVRDRAPLLDSGLPEAILPTWRGWLTSLFDEGHGEALGVTEASILEGLRAAIERVPAEGPRLRLLAAFLSGY